MTTPDRADSGQTTTGELTRRAADRLAGKLTRYLTGAAQQGTQWTKRVGADGAPFWTSHRHDRSWAVHIPDPAHHPTAEADVVDPAFLTALGQAVAAMAAAEQRSVPAVIADILASGRTRAKAQAPAADGLPLAELWQASTPRRQVPRVIARPARDQRLDAAIAAAFTRAYRQAWDQRLHALLVAEGTTALRRLRTRGDPPPPPVPRNRDQAARLYAQITAASAERYLAGHGWQPLDQTAELRRWHNGADAIVEIPTSHSPGRQATLRATAYTIADHEQREAGEVLVELTDPPLRDPQLARIHTLLTNPPAASDAQAASRLATASVPTRDGNRPLAEAARHQAATLGATDLVWKLATAAGEADAATALAQLLGTAAPDQPAPMSPFAHPGEPAQRVAARIWATGAHLPPAQHARWFTHTWWPYHLTGTTGTVAAYLASRLGHHPPAVLPPPGPPSHDLFKAVDAATGPDRSSHDRFVAVYRLVDAAARPRAVQAAAQAIRDHLTGTGQPIDEPALHAAAAHAGDPRRYAHPPTEAGLRAALAAAMPPDPSRHTPPAAAKPHTASFPPPWQAVAAATRPATPGGPPLVVDPARYRQQQLVATAAQAVQAGVVPTPPPTRAASPSGRPRR